MKSSPSQILTALEIKARTPGASLPAIAETWIMTNRGSLRLALCHSRYGWHWEIGSYRSTALMSVRVLGIDQTRQVHTLLAALLRDDAIN